MNYRNFLFLFFHLVQLISTIKLKNRIKIKKRINFFVHSVSVSSVSSKLKINIITIILESEIRRLIAYF
jgi:hypothetical protein